MGGGAEPLSCELDVVSLRHDCGAAGSRLQGGRAPPTPDPHPASAVPPRAPAPQPSLRAGHVHFVLAQKHFTVDSINLLPSKFSSRSLELKGSPEAREVEGPAMKDRGEASTQPSRNGRRLRVWVCQTWAFKGAMYDAARPRGGTLVQGAHVDDVAPGDPSSYARST